MAHLFDHDARNGTAVPVGGCRFEKMPLLLYAGELSVALIDDHIQQRVAHLLGRNLTQVLPLAPAFEMAELDFFSFNCAKERVELEIGRASCRERVKLRC